jgi:hypothetical protein
MFGVKSGAAILALVCVSFAMSSPAAGCDYYDCAIGPMPMAAPDAFYTPQTSLWTYPDGSTTPSYTSNWNPAPTLQQTWDRVVYVVEHLFDGMSRYDQLTGYGAPRG